MDTPYYVASLKGGGWFSRSSQFNTQMSEAKAMDRDEALALVARYKSNGHACVPVRAEDLV